MKTPRRFLLFILALGCLHLGVLVYAIVNNEMILHFGQPVKFKVALQDPYDVFRGKYAQIQADTGVVVGDTRTIFDIQDSVFVALKKDAEGFSTLYSVQKSKPADSVYLKTVVDGVSASSYSRENRNGPLPTKGVVKGKKGTTVYVHFPFSRVYFEEPKVAIIESQLRNSWITGPKPYLLVRMLGGKGVVEDLYLYGEIDGKSAYYSSKAWLDFLPEKVVHQIK